MPYANKELKELLLAIFVFKSRIKMKLLLEVKDEQIESVMKVIKNLKGVKATRVNSNAKTLRRKTEKEKIIASIKAAVKEVKLAKEGKIKLKTWDEALQEMK